jgi:periplasmic mercuric ion binding protein
MKKHILASTLLIALSLTVRAADPIVVEGPHSCCDGCKNTIKKAVAGLRDVSVDEKKGTIMAKSKSSAKKAAEALMENGFYATVGGAGAESKSASSTAEKPAVSSTGKKVKSATVTGAHNCCLKCRNMIMDAVRETAGVTSAEVEVKATSFTVAGEFTKEDLLASLNKAGFNGKIK